MEKKGKGEDKTPTRKKNKRKGRKDTRVREKGEGGEGRESIANMD